MAKIRKSEPLPYWVVCDTNILWCEDKGPVAHPEFEEFWDRATSQFDLSMYVPEVSYGELLYQHCTSCEKALKGAEELFHKVSAITSAKHKVRLTRDRTKEQIRDKFSRWLRRRRGKLIPFAPEAVDWRKLMNDAIWREPPFVADPKNPDFEKGFRDALILESICCFAKTQTSAVNLVFLCNDRILRQAAVDRLKTDSRFVAFESVKEFESHLLLTKEQLTNQFIAKILSRARERFYSSDDPTCLWTRDALRTKLQKDFEEYFNDPLKSEERGLATLGLSFSTGKWSRIAGGKFWIRRPEFVRIEGERTYHWLSVATFVEAYKQEKSADAPRGLFSDLLIPPPQEKALFLPFKISWSSRIKNDARFHDLRVEAVKLEDNVFRVPNAEEIKSYELSLGQTSTPVSG